MNTLPPHQLGLNRTILQTIAIQVYGELFQQLHHNLSMVYGHQIDNGCTQLAKWLPRYRMVASKACFANVYYNNNQESLLTLQHRLSSFQLYVDILSCDAFKRCPQLSAEGLKLAAELGYEYLDIMIQNRYLWVDEMQLQFSDVVANMKQILKTLLASVHVTQRHIVQHMQDDFDQFLLRNHVADCELYGGNNRGVSLACDNHH